MDTIEHTRSALRRTSSMGRNRKLLQGLVVLALATVAFGAHAGTAAYYIYDEDGHVIGEYNTDGTPIQEHVYLNDRPVAVLQNGSTDYVSTDQLDTPRIITDSNKNVLWQWNSDPYGNGQPTGSLTYNLRFPGQYYDSETGHNYNMNRDYEPQTGRYVESDPIGLWGGVNTYVYARNNPLSFIDPLGLYWQYSQSTGQMTYVDNTTGASTSVGVGYSGNGEGLNNGNMQGVPFVGPIPVGDYNVLPAENHPGNPYMLPLQPTDGTDTSGRSDLFIHGDNGNGDNSASEGCIVIDRNTRYLMNISWDRELRVVP